MIRKMEKIIVALIFFLVLCVLTCCKSTPMGPKFDHPDLSPAQQKSFKQYLDDEKYPHFKAFAVEVDGDYSIVGFGYNRPEHAIVTAMQSCGGKGADCNLYAVGEKVVTNFNQDKLSNYLLDYYEKILPPSDLTDIKKRALTNDEIKALFTGHEFEGFSKSTKWIMKFEDERHLIFQILETKTKASLGKRRGEWWTEGDRLCRKYEKAYSGRTECFYLIKEENGFAFFSEDGSFVDRMWPIKTLNSQ